MAETLAGTLSGPAPAPSVPGSPVRYNCIEGLRALAALAVFFIHVSETRYGASFGYHAIGIDRYVRAFFDELAVGVPIFFVISGFVIYRPFAARHLGGKGEPSTISYIARRVLRIYPAYWVALVGTVLVFSDLVTVRGPAHWFANLGLVQWYVPGATGHGFVLEGMIQSWTLTSEVTFYATLPIFVYAIRRFASGDLFRAHAMGVAGVITVGVAARMWLIFGSPPTWVEYLPIYLAFFGTGMALALVTIAVARGGAAPRFLARCAEHPGWCAAVALVAFLIATVTADITDGPVILLNSTPIWEQLVRFFLQWVVVAALIVPAVLSIEQGGRVRATLGSRVAVFLGSISYGFYLWHWAIIRWLSKHWFHATSGQTMLKVTVVGLPATIAIAYASFRLVEKPLI
ncbi:MAG TPA: acyltransferase, partial [Acidimicrobiia bacterium]